MVKRPSANFTSTLFSSRPGSSAVISYSFSFSTMSTAGALPKESSPRQNGSTSNGARLAGQPSLPQAAKALDLPKKPLAAIRSEARIGPHFKPTVLKIEADGTATIQAEVDNVAIKRLALERLSATKGVTAIVDRLRVKPAMAMSDDGILDHLRKSFYDEPAFRQLKLKEREGGKVKLVRDAFEEARGEIEFEVKKGVVILKIGRA